ncbi:MAG: metallophosphoesterase [Pirellulales bacterium]|nr:metallophosphoesterase [Pirellulales bacterium]
MRMALTVRHFILGLVLAWILFHGESLAAERDPSVRFLPGETTGNVEGSDVVEASGLVASRKHLDVFWTHNDSGDSARIFALNKQGALLGTFNIPGAKAIDWEDIALGPGPASGVDYLYIGDIGDNNGKRSSIRVYRVPEPVVRADQEPVTADIADVATITLVYPDGPRDAETLLVDPLTGDLFIVSKRDSQARIYRARFPLAEGETTTLECMGEMEGTGFVAGDISPNGTEILMKTYFAVLLFPRPLGTDVWTALESDSIVVPYKFEPQGESVTFDREGRDYYTLSEGANQPLRRFPRKGDPAAQVTAAIIGGYGFDGPGEAAVAALVDGWNPDLVATVGGNNYDTGAASTIDANIGKYYQRFIGNYGGMFGRGTATNRFFPALDTHDWQSAGAAPYLEYFTLPGNERYYDFVAGAIHFFVLDSDPREPDGVDAQSKQARWLRDELASSASPFQVVLLHRAPYSSGEEQSADVPLRWPLREWGADLVIAGSSHTYERLEIDGLSYLVNGLGGRRIDGFGELAAGSQAIYNGEHGALRVKADSSQMTVEFFAVGDGDTPIDTLQIPRVGKPEGASTKAEAGAGEALPPK